MGSKYPDTTHYMSSWLIRSIILTPGNDVVLLLFQIHWRYKQPTGPNLGQLGLDENFKLLGLTQTTFSSLPDFEGPKCLNFVCTQLDDENSEFGAIMAQNGCACNNPVIHPRNRARMVWLRASKFNVTTRRTMLSTIVSKWGFGHKILLYKINYLNYITICTWLQHTFKELLNIPYSNRVVLWTGE